MRQLTEIVTRSPSNGNLAASDSRPDEIDGFRYFQLVDEEDIGLLPIEETGGPITVSVGSAGPVGVIASVASNQLNGRKLDEGFEDSGSLASLLTTQG